MVNGVSFLSPEFLKKHENLTPKNKGILFDQVRLRTYSRFLPDKKRRENWQETIARVVNYNVGLYTGSASPEDLIKEAEMMFDKLFNLDVYPSGRAYWVGGTKACEKQPESVFNCTVLVLDELEDFCDLFHLLLVGAGVGFRVLKEDVAKFPTLQYVTEIENLAYQPIASHERLEDTEIYKYPKAYEILIGDSREGWVEALRHVLEGFLLGVPIIRLNYNSIRPKNERIKTFGGRAPGPEGFMKMFKNLEKVIKRSKGLLTPIIATDIANIIADNVIIGGTRRSSEIALGSSDDEDFKDAKLPENFKDNKHRKMSNNSIVYKSKPSKDEINKILTRIRQSWEPGFINWKFLSSRRPWLGGVNPCGEALCADKGNCNLSGIYLPAYISPNGIGFDFEALDRGIRLATRIGMRQTNVTWSLPKWDEVHKRDRLLGVSITGLMDALDELSWEFDSYEAISLWKFLKQAANDEATRYAFEMRIPRPLLVTLLKPEGSISQLMTCSPGIHRVWAPYYIRTIRISDGDPVCKALQSLGVPNEPDIEKPERIVFSFPIKSKAKQAANDEPARRQLERYLTLMKHYVDHNASCTINVGPHEWEELENMIYENWDNIGAIALANKSLDENTTYKQLPYQQISEIQYNEWVQRMPDMSNLEEIVAKFEQEEELYEIIEDTCSSGVCPVR